MAAEPEAFWFGLGRPQCFGMLPDLPWIARAGVKLLIVFAAAEIGAEYLRTFGGQPLVEFQRSGRLTIVDIAGGDHVFSAPGARQRLLEAVTNHLDEMYPRQPKKVRSNGGGGADDAPWTWPDGRVPVLFDRLKFEGGQI